MDSTGLLHSEIQSAAADLQRPMQLGDRLSERQYYPMQVCPMFTSLGNVLHPSHVTTITLRHLGVG